MKDKKLLDNIVKDFRKSESINSIAKKYGLSYHAVYSKLYRRGEIDPETIKVRNKRVINKAGTGKINTLFIPKYFLDWSGLTSDELLVNFIPKRKKLWIKIENYE